MPSWAINNTNFQKQIKLNKMQKTSKNNETAQLGIGAVSGSLSIKEVAAKYGEKVECMFYDYDNEWKKKTMVVNASFLKDMEQGAVKDCH